MPQHALALVVPGVDTLTSGTATSGALMSPPDRAALHAASRRDVLRTLHGMPDLDVAPVPSGLDAMDRAVVTWVQEAMETSDDDRVILVCTDTAPTLTHGEVADAVASLTSGAADVLARTSSDGGPVLVAASARIWRKHLLSVPKIAATSQTSLLEQVLSVITADASLVVQRLPDAPSIADDVQAQALAVALMADPTLHAPATRSVLRRLTSFATTRLRIDARWPVLAQDVLFESPRRVAVRDHTRIPHGEVIDYTYLITSDAVRIVAVTTDAQVVMVRQYRVPIRDWSLELPAGGLEPGEDVLEAAARELLEEVGGTAGSLQVVGGFPSSTAHLRHYGTVVLALDVTLGAAPMLEATEDLVLVSVPLAEALDMARSGDLGDAESALALLMCEAAIATALVARTRASAT